MNTFASLIHGQTDQPGARDPEDEHLDQELENILNHAAPPYSDPTYWSGRYEKEPEPFNWYQPWSRLNSLGH
jgi:hypothetical protein